MGEFEKVLREQIAAAVDGMLAARSAGDAEEAKSFRARLGYLLGIAAEHRITVDLASLPEEFTV
jgi:hypothetical protein